MKNFVNVPLLSIPKKIIKHSELKNGIEPSTSHYDQNGDVRLKRLFKAISKDIPIGENTVSVEILNSMENPTTNRVNAKSTYSLKWSHIAPILPEEETYQLKDGSGWVTDKIIEFHDYPAVYLCQILVYLKNLESKFGKIPIQARIDFSSTVKRRSLKGPRYKSILIKPQKRIYLLDGSLPVDKRSVRKIHIRKIVISFNVPDLDTYFKSVIKDKLSH